MERSLALLFVQVALGALIGGLMALEIGVCFAYGSYFWSIGAFLGGFVAYWSVDFKQILAGIAHSYRQTIAWRPDRLYWKTFFVVFGGLEVLLLSVYSASAVVFAWVDNTFSVIALPSKTFALLLAVGTFLASDLALNVVSRRYNRTDSEWARWLEDKRDFGLKMMLYSNPAGVLYWLVVGLVWAVVRIPRATVAGASVTLAALYAIGRGIRMVALFIAGVFVYVHSERRTRRLVYATLGAMIGYVLGHATIGAFAGGILAVVSYKLTPVRWLKLAPATRPQ